MRNLVLAVLGAIGAVGPAAAAETRLAIRALADDAKFIGTGMSGMAVIVEDADTGQILDTGVTRGATGDTNRIVRTPRERYGVLAGEGDAVHVATLDIDEPRRIRVTVRGPLGQPQAMAEASSVRWVLPGRHIEAGDGWLIEVPGFAVDILAPGAYTYVLDGRESMTVTANVIMLCGCPTEPGGTWDAGRIEVTAEVRRDGQEVATLPMSYAGVLSTFSVDVPSKEKGAYEILVTAYDPGTGNTGLDRSSFVVR